MASLLTPSVGEIWKNKNSNEKVVIQSGWQSDSDNIMTNGENWCTIWWAEIVENIGARLIMKPTDISENDMIEHWERHQTIEQRLNRVGTAGYSWFGIENWRRYSVEEITPISVDNHDGTIMYVTERNNYTTKKQMGKQMFCSSYFETSHDIELGDVFVACARPNLDNNGRYYNSSRLILHQFIDEGDKKYLFRRWDGVSPRARNRARDDRYDRTISPEDLFILFRRVRYFSYVHHLSVFLTLIHNDRSTDVPIYHPLTFGNPIPTTTNRDPYPGQIWTRSGLVYYIAFEPQEIPTCWVLKELTAGDRNSNQCYPKMSIDSENGWSFVMRYVEHWDWFPNRSNLFNQKNFLREVDLIQMEENRNSRNWRLTTEYYRRFCVGQIYQRNTQRRPPWITSCRYWKELDPDDNRYKPKVSNLINNIERQGISGNDDSGHKVMIIDIYGDGSLGGVVDEIYYCSMSVGLWNGEDSTSSRERGFYFQNTYRIYKTNVRQFDAIFNAIPRGSNSTTTTLTDFDFFDEPSNISGGSSGSSSGSSSKNNNKRKAASDKESKTKKAKKGDIRCGICLTNEANTIFLPCGHLYACYECAKKCKDVYGGKCPICKRKIDSLMRIFISATVYDDELKQMLNNLRIKF